MERETIEKSAIRKKYFIKSQVIVMFGYAMTQAGTLVARQLGFSSISYGEILFVTLSTMGFTLLVTVVVKPKKIISNAFIQTVVKIQFVFWLMMYMFWIYFLQEARILGLFFAFMPLIFLATNSNFIQSLIISIAVAVIQLVASYYAINFAHQGGSFKDVVFYTSWFFPSALYIAYVAGLFHKKRKEVRQSKQDAELARDALWGEMELAKKIQTILLPKRPDILGYEIASYMSPANEVGGDYYDIIDFNGYHWIIIGDVSGHGVPAGLVMMMTQTAIHNSLQDDPRISPSDLLIKINKTITANIKLMDESTYMTITVFAVVEDNHLVYSGLHQDIFIYRERDDRVETLQTEGMWIGLIDDITPMVNDKKFHLDRGDCMLLYTDGVTESWEAGHGNDADKRAPRYFGKDRLKAILNDGGKSSPEILKRKILDELNHYRNNDDVTFLIIKRVN
ncbi:MAG: SpoIIE family protein phosphatase [Spirochaetes bacterium]|jgi:serine phosphatase RsbU (regulator of sigma subunit)|nr:SpoIIE family protein phosphatase [Spirochaetota bacterium]